MRYDKTIKNSNSFLTNTPHKIRKQAGTGACFLYAAKRLGSPGGEIPVFLDFYSDSCKINQYAKLHKNGEDEQYPDCTARERGSWAERPLRNRTRGRSHRSSKRNESRLLRSAKPGGQSDSNERNKGGTADYRYDSRFVLCSRSQDLQGRDGFFIKGATQHGEKSRKNLQSERF